MAGNKGTKRPREETKDDDIPTDSKRPRSYEDHLSHLGLNRSNERIPLTRASSESGFLPRKTSSVDTQYVGSQSEESEREDAYESSDVRDPSGHTVRFRNDKQTLEDNVIQLSTNNREIHLNNVAFTADGECIMIQLRVGSPEIAILEEVNLRRKKAKAVNPTQAACPRWRGSAKELKEKSKEIFGIDSPWLGDKNYFEHKAFQQFRCSYKNRDDGKRDYYIESSISTVIKEDIAKIHAPVYDEKGVMFYCAMRLMEEYSTCANYCINYVRTKYYDIVDRQTAKLLYPSKLSTITRPLFKVIRMILVKCGAKTWPPGRRQTAVDIMFNIFEDYLGIQFVPQVNREGVFANLSTRKNECWRLELVDDLRNPTANPSNE
uniref:Uncharacterized protein n=1 Tax=Strongyloides papillosus TaxID=174720 RepID=A0A0N5BLM5_STREA